MLAAIGHFLLIDLMIGTHAIHSGDFLSGPGQSKITLKAEPNSPCPYKAAGRHRRYRSTNAGHMASGHGIPASCPYRPSSGVVILAGSPAPLAPIVRFSGQFAKDCVVT